MHYTYSTLKELAARTGRRVTDLLALAPQNDPFYVGMPAQVIQAEWFADLWRRAAYTSGVHLRRVHYWCVSQTPAVPMPDGKPYENTEACWKFLTQASKAARYLGLVRIADIADNKNPTPHIQANYWSDEPEYELDIPNLTAPTINVYGIHDTNVQPYHLELWCEKSTMNDVLLPIGQRYNANVVTFEGEVSITACYDLMRRIERSGGKPTRIFYLSDFDPAGNSMPVAMSRKTEYMLNAYECDFDVKLKPVVLTAGQVERYRLPRIPIKDTEKRAARFEQAFGTGAVELDALEALHRGELARIVTGAIKPYYSQEAANEAQQQADALRQAISAQAEAITARYSREIAALATMQEELRAIDLDPDEYAVDRYAPHVDEDDGEWLFSSERDYLDQIAAYKAHKGIEVAS